MYRRNTENEEPPKTLSSRYTFPISDTRRIEIKDIDKFKESGLTRKAQIGIIGFKLELQPSFSPTNNDCLKAYLWVKPKYEPEEFYPMHVNLKCSLRIINQKEPNNDFVRHWNQFSFDSCSTSNSTRELKVISCEELFSETYMKNGKIVMQWETIILNETVREENWFDSDTSSCIPAYWLIFFFSMLPAMNDISFLLSWTLIFAIWEAIKLLSFVVWFIHQKLKVSKKIQCRNSMLIGFGGILLLSIIVRVLPYFLDFNTLKVFFYFPSFLCMSIVALHYHFISNLKKKIEFDHSISWITWILHVIMLFVFLGFIIPSRESHNWIGIFFTQFGFFWLTCASMNDFQKLCRGKYEMVYHSMREPREENLQLKAVVVQKGRKEETEPEKSELLEQQPSV